MVVRLKMNLHPGQETIYRDPHRFKVITAGRRFGKTEGVSRIVSAKALPLKDGEIYLIAPTYKLIKKLWKKIRKFIPPQYVQGVREGDYELELVNGTTIHAMSGDNPDSLVGEGLDGVVIDEAARCKKEVWEAVEPALMDKHGWAYVISTPKGKNWFWDLYHMEDEDPDFKSFHFSSYDNPHLDPAEIDRLARNMPELIYKQEIMAEFIDSGGEVFRNFFNVLGDFTLPPISDKQYVMGLDLAKYQDWTVITIADLDTNEIFLKDRFNQLDWDYQRKRIEQVCHEYNDCTIIIDATAGGDVIAEDLQRAGLPVKPVKFTQLSKPQLITNLMLMIDAGNIRLQNDPKLVREFEQFAYEITEGGNMKFHAPEGRHDDIVISTALCAWGLEQGVAKVVGAIASDGRNSNFDKEGVEHKSALESFYDGEDLQLADWDED